MFKNDYQTAMDNIKADSYVNNKIRSKLVAFEDSKQRAKNPAVPWRIGFAAVAAAAMILSVIFIPRSNTKVQISNQTLNAANSYDEIYKILKKANRKKFSLYNGVTDDVEILYDYEYEYEADGSMTGGTMTGGTASQDTSAGGGLKGENESSKNDYSNTTEQVEGVSEADIIKTDGEYIYALFSDRIEVIKADGKNTVHVSTKQISGDYDFKNYYSVSNEMYLNGDHLVIITNSYVDNENTNYCVAIIFDISDPSEIKQVNECKQKGSYIDSRMIGNYVYLITDCSIRGEIIKEKPETYVPTIICKGVEKAVPADSIYRYDNDQDFADYTVISAFNVQSGTMSSNVSLLGGADQIYCSKQNIITANTVYGEAEPEEFDTLYPTCTTTVSRLAINGGALEYKASGSINGYLDDQFFMDEHNGYFRFVTTVDYAKKTLSTFANTKDSIATYTTERCAELTVLDGELKQTGNITDLAKGEKVYSVRFMGDIAYFVTFRQTDPLFSADLSDPNNPKIIGELKIPGFSEYLYPYGEGKLLGFGYDADEKTGRTKGLKLSMFNTLDPANVTEEDKSVIEKFDYSPALYDHKAMLVSPGKNLIGFATTDYNNNYYVIYEYTGNSFLQKAKLPVVYKNADYLGEIDPIQAIRGLFIGDNFYIIHAQGVYCYSLDGFSVLSEIQF